MKHKFFSVMTSCLVCFMFVVGLIGCSESDDLGGGGSNGKSIKLQKLDFSGAKYLTLVDNTRAADGDEVGLFKIDEQGNMTTVVLSCTEEEDGTVTKTRTDIKVIPSNVYSLCGAYTYMSDCRFTDNNGYEVWMKQYYEPEARDFNILVRNADGAIFYVPQALVNSYFCYDQGFYGASLDNKGNLYLLGTDEDNNILGQLTVQNGQMVVKQISPKGISIAGGGILPFDNGTVMVNRADTWLNCTLFYPNGGFEEWLGYRLLEKFENGGYTDESILPVSRVKSGLKTIMVKGIHNEDLSKNKEYIVSLCDFRVGTSYGDHSLSEPLSTLSSGCDYSWEPGDANFLKWVYDCFYSNFQSLHGIYETENWYIIGTSLVVDKNTMEMRPLEGDELNIIFPTESNTYKGRSWAADAEGADWYDVETLQSGRVDFHLPKNFKQNNTTTDIPSGKVIVSGTRFTDGKSVTYFIDIETGSYTCTEADSERPITALIPLN